MAPGPPDPPERAAATARKRRGTAGTVRTGPRGRGVATGPRGERRSRPSPQNRAPAVATPPRHHRDHPRCVRCWTRYCDASCQLEHWNNGHKKQCKKIARGGGAERFYADAKYKEAAAAAVSRAARNQKVRRVEDRQIVASTPQRQREAICTGCRVLSSR